MMSPVGLLAIESFRPGFYTEQHLILADTVARQIAIAIGHAQALHSVDAKAETDALTGLANRQTLDERGQEIFRNAMSEGKPLGLILVDIDRFKVTNDRHGHEHGDGILRSVSAIIAENLRGNDFPARYGGDEFVVLLSGANVQEAFSIAERIRLRVAYAAPDEKGVAPHGQHRRPLGHSEPEGSPARVTSPAPTAPCTKPRRWDETGAACPRNLCGPGTDQSSTPVRALNAALSLSR